MRKLYFRQGLLLLLCLCMILPLLAVPALGTETEEEETQEAQNISRAKYITECVGFPSYGYFFDGKTLYGGKSTGNGHFTVKHADGVGSIYIIFQHEFGPYTVTNNDSGETVTVGQNYFLHDFLDMEELFGTCPNSVTVKFSGKVAHINELYLFTPGEVPEFVQKWDEPADGETDLVLFSTHGDDEQLFFAGILPYYAGELELNVQVVYLTGHQNSYPNRMREMLNGLYAVGVRAYPVFGPFPDQLSMTKADAYQQFANKGYSREILLEFVVENLRRFRPLVAIGHDIRGEYGHGQHRVYADLLMEAVQIAADPSRFPYSAGRYGLWDTPKTYLHLYKENPIVLDWDRPLSKFGGMTAFEVTRDLGFPCHVSQYYDFLWYLTQARTAAAMWKYSPCKYGLFRSTVGEDVDKNEFFENLEGFLRPPILRKKPLLPPLPGAADRNSLWN